MALPENISTVTVTGTFLSASGAPLTGHIGFTPSVPVTTASGETGVVFLARPTQVRLVDGAFTIDLPATDADLQPSGFTYLVQEIVGSAGREYSIELPAATPSVDLAEVSPVTPVTAVSEYARLGAENEFTESQTLRSSYEGGDREFDSTSRLNVESHQRATRREPYGEVVRAILQRGTAKAMIAWQENYTGHEESPRTVAWIGAHGEANDGQSWHNHISIEVPDENGSMQTALEIPFAQFDEPNGYGIAQPDRYIRAIAKLIARARLSVEGPAETSRRLDFGTVDDTNIGGKNEYRRWSVALSNSPESGDDHGSDFRINRRDDGGSYVDSPIHINRHDGYVGIWNTDPQSRFHVGSHAQMSGNLTLDGSYVTIESGTTYRLQGTTDRDIEFSDSAAGPVLTDRTTGSKYRLVVDDGVLGVEPP